MAQFLVKYGKKFDLTVKDEKGDVFWDDLQIEFFCIKEGKEWVEKAGRTLGFHYENCRKLLWPELDDHRWHRLCRDSMLENKICVLLGCASSAKTHSAAWMYLLDYFIFPQETCVLVCSTDLRGLKKRVWGEITMLWERAVARYNYLPGHLLDSAIAITTDNVDDFEIGQRRARNMRQGLFGIPCVQSGKWVGLAKFIGIKQKRMRLIADEASAMDGSFLSAFANLNNNEDFRAVVVGNPNDIQDPLGKAAEPAGGWTDEYLGPTKTRTWKTRFMNGICVNLVGLDSPNNDFPDGKTRYKYLISKEKIADTLTFFSKDSVEYYSQVVGTMKVGTMARRILTREMVEKYGAQKEAIWKDDQRTKVYFCDASYGGDLCVGLSGEFGQDIDGKTIISFGEPRVIPIIVGAGEGAEFQIARQIKQDCEVLGIPPENVGHDATGRGSLGTALAMLWSAQCHPIESGGAPSDRPVSLDLFTLDDETGLRRLKLCKEFYDRRVSEFWFCVKFAVEAGQVRDLPEAALDDFCSRKWDVMKDGKHFVEVKDGTKTKPGMKQRTGRSPDHGDAAAGVIEMARRKGFQIAKLSTSETNKTVAADWFTKEAARLSKFNQSQQLQTL